MSEVAKLPKPQLRGLLTSQIKRNLVFGAVFAFVVTAAYKMNINDKRKIKYAEFYKNYDPQREYEQMKKAGIFQSARPE
ncbi:cytochrome c oxidase subunit 6C-like [Artemia franciscana]|uniref:Cytochrome c oxidase subunit 6C n=1 Tax=Artemia franciscana TaxID=6661 RepID=A0AA88H9G7_ARTSF|nr:hypothetical protein QYM36_018176 [Artemia franciscana]